MNKRDCENCKNHTDKGCTKWECEFELSSATRKNSKKLEKDFGELDCISRAEAIKCLECDFDITGKENMKTVVNYINSAHDKIVNLPRVKQEPKTGHCKDCKWWKDSDGVYRRGCRAESHCPINRREVFEGNGYCYMFEPQESEDKE